MVNHINNKTRFIVNGQNPFELALRLMDEADRNLLFLTLSIVCKNQEIFKQFFADMSKLTVSL